MNATATVNANDYVLPWLRTYLDNSIDNVRYTKSGEVDKRHCNKVAGVSSEVYAFRTDEEINSMLSVFNNRIMFATSPTNEQIAERDKMLFVIGINIGIRASDLCVLKWGFFFDSNLEWKDHYKFMPKKQRKAHKFVTIKFNNAVRTAVNSYLEKYPITKDDLDKYVFASRKGDGAITERGLCAIIKETAKKAGIKQNIGSHSMRKTFGYRIWNAAEDKDKALVMLQLMFSHSDTRTTMKYIGILQDDLDDMYDSIGLGIE